MNDRVLRFRIRRPPHFERLHVDVLTGDVFRKLDVGRPWLLETREAEGLADDLGRRLADADPRAPFRDRAEHAHDVDVLVRFLMRAFETDLARDRDEGSAVDLRVGDSGDEIRGTRPECGQADTGIRRETTVHIGHEGGALLVPGEHELDLLALREGGVERERLLARDTEDVPNALVLQAFHQELRDVQRAASPMRRSTMTVSRHTPSSFACLRYVPTSRNPTFASSLRLGSFSGKTRERSFHIPRASHSLTSASIAARPAP